MDQLPPNWINLGIAGLLAIAFIGAHLYTLKTLIPSMLTTFREELAAERTANAVHVEAILTRINGLESKVDGLSRRGEPPHPFVRRDYGEGR